MMEEVDDAVKAVFSKPSEVIPKYAYNDHEYDHYDKFAAHCDFLINNGCRAT